ncbi:uncharacterized protein LOC122853840 [Aphidius gifuensis]|uniref:uncharacterized protein LOC122853840 n=1 Tax=Aphidius gifuensis TaxID=684658 RepID=UPI001CDD4B79|nr:uncharacterized protein LOC122853840 [Aphidius gifuensis]
MDEILSIQEPIIFDESIAHCELHAHQPYGSSTFNNNDEIRIGIQHQDLCVLPSKSSLHITGRFLTSDGKSVPKTTSLVRMAIAHMFEEIRYEINAIEIDRSKNVGLTTLMKGYISLSPNQKSLLENAGWLMSDEESLFDSSGYFDISIPLSLLLGFAEDYKKIIINAKHELILIRANSDANACLQEQPAEGKSGEKIQIKLQKVEWIVPYIKVSDKQKIQLLNYIAKDPSIAISFRTWELYEYPLLPATTKQNWSVKTSTQLEKPRYIILGFQTGRKNSVTNNSSVFDHCNLRDVKLFLNSQSYPYGNLNIDFAHNQFSLLYDMFAYFQASYYYTETPQPLFTRQKFLEEAPLIVIDCSKQNEFLKSGPVDIRLEFESTTQFPAQTSAYCLILHDRIVEYNPISGSVRKLV